MSVEERRRMIVHAVLPLLIERGAAITTSQIARAAGIGEGTIFRAFKDKEELFAACSVEVMRPDAVLDALAEIPIDLALEDRLVEAAEAMGAHLERMGALIGALHASGQHIRRTPEDAKKRLTRNKDARRESVAAIRTAIAELLEPDKDQLRVPVDQLAGLFVTLHFGGGRRMASDVPAPAIREVVHILLHGALKEAE